MTPRLPIHDEASAPAEARQMLSKVRGAFGFLPNLIGGLAGSPSALRAYLALAEQFAGSSLTPVEQQVVALSVSAANGCGYCVAAHSALAAKALTATQIAALRDGGVLDDARLEGLAEFVRAVVDRRGWVDESVVIAFERAGYQRSQALDVLVGVAQKTLSNYANHLIDTPLDDAFESTRWQPTQGPEN